jgi:hypothetical protein
MKLKPINKKDKTMMTTTNYKIKTEVRDGNKIAVIQPSIAQKIFTERLPNRPFSMQRAKMYAKSMSEGKWKPCSQLSFCNGKLDDGQHRIMASVLSGVPFEGTVYHHNDPSTFSVFDIGKKRSNSDVLAIEGNKNVNVLAATLQVLEKLHSPSGLPNAVGGRTIVQVPTYEIMNVLKKYPGIEDSVNMVASYIKHFRIPAASTAVLHYYLKRAMGDSIFSANNATTEKNLADRFIIDKLLKGLQLTENDPVYQFRKQLLKIKTATNIVGGSRISHNIMIMGGITT